MTILRRAPEDVEIYVSFRTIPDVGCLPAPAVSAANGPKRTSLAYGIRDTIAFAFQPQRLSALKTIACNGMNATADRAR
jgi:hypothetical protein